MSDKLHLIVTAPSPPSLPANLRALLARMVPTTRIDCEEDSLSQPSEIATARALGLPSEDGRIPWAAVETSTVGTPCAWITLCHWRVGADHVTLVPARELLLDAAEEQTLYAAMAPYFAEDGIQLQMQPALPGVWLATGEAFRGLATLSMERAVAQRLTPDHLTTGGAAAATLRRLQNEMQMLLYTHPLTEEREARGLLPVNSFWVTGAGVLDRTFVPDPTVLVEAQLQDSSCARLLALLQAGGAAQLTLCGPKAAQSFGPAPAGVLPGLKRVLGLQPAWNGLETL